VVLANNTNNDRWGTIFAYAEECGDKCCLAVAVPYSFNLDYVGNFSSAWVVLLNDEMINVTALSEVTEKYASSGMIDPTGNMLMDRVFIYSSLDDIYILTGHVHLYLRPPRR